MLDAIVIGGGVFGARLAEWLAADGRRVELVEREPDLLLRASLTNQARVHRGYHYPRSFVTAARSWVNAPRFEAEFRACIVDSFAHHYAIGRTGSKVSARQFRSFCQRIGAPVTEAPAAVRRWFDPARIEAVFTVREHAFDALALRTQLRRALDAAGVGIRLGSEAIRVAADPAGGLRLSVESPAGTTELVAREVYNCTYSRLNALLHASGLPLIELRHELAEMLLVEPPEELREAAVTVMCGPFFSCMPFPPRGLHTLSHVRYTPHRTWADGPSVPWRDPDVARGPTPPSQGPAMLRDAARYLPLMAGSRPVDSLWEVKTVLPRSEVDDSRPILVRVGHGLPGLTCIAGAKLDNLYDMFDILAPDPAATREAAR